MKSLCLYALFAASLTATAARADTVTFAISPSTVSTVPGGTATYTATISAPLDNGAPVFLNGDTITFAGPADITFDDGGLFGNFPVFLAPGDSDTAPLFTVGVPSGELAGSYLGSYVLQGGADGGAEDILGTQSFTLDVTAATGSSVTPEPSSYLLLSTGILAALALAARKRTVEGTQV
ncbi:MAG TPA: PEP-CTERM sorting domain-containing protein [Acidobacteriaceae bacterium]|nr:PEP-CTERM sorting domain-containing protein [Acidobacteriaceae bacterium]